jgi:hypothetical protein
MGASAPKENPNQPAWDSFYGDDNPLKPQPVLKGRRGLPGGPILPKLPPNPYATKARSIGRALNTPPIFPKLPNWPDDML